VAVVATLAFLLLQLRQANRSQKAAIQQGRTDIVTWTMRQSEPQMSALIARLFEGETTLTSAEAQSFGSYAAAFFWHMEDSFLQHRGGTLDGTGWATDVATLRGFLAIPAFRVAWKFNRASSSGPTGTMSTPGSAR
jgi:hypothetical protein